MSHSLFTQGTFEDVQHYLHHAHPRNGDGMLHEVVLNVLHIAPSDPGMVCVWGGV